MILITLCNITIFANNIKIILILLLRKIIIKLFCNVMDTWSC